MSNQEIIDEICGFHYEVNKDFYYHAFDYESSSFISMLTEGIKSPFITHKSMEGHNSSFYVSLMKNEPCKENVYTILKDLPMMVIDSNIKVIKARNLKTTKPSYEIFSKTPLPWRSSEYDNEYQAFLRVKSKDIIGINFILNPEQPRDEFIKRFYLLRLMVINLYKNNVEKPIINNYLDFKYDKEKIMSLNIK